MIELIHFIHFHSNYDSLASVRGNTVRRWRKLQTEDLHDLYCLLNASTILIKSSYHHLDGQLGLDRPVSTSSNCPFRALSSRLLPSGLQSSIIFAILLLSILVQCSMSQPI